jgi:glutathione synthase/RimK-type ligase-like ATP-grasp enzyme/ribosomal protein S18 acetylase RimI-like enzyme
MSLIRPATEDDLEALLRIEADSFVLDRLSRRSFRAALKAQNQALLVAQGGEGEAEGYALLHLRPDQGRARLYSLAVAPKMRGAGLGRDLLAAAEAQAAGRGLGRMRLEVNVDDLGTQEFYLRHGYGRIRELPGFYQDGQAAYRMEKVLAALPGVDMGKRQPSVVVVVGRSQDRKLLSETMRGLGLPVITASDYLSQPEKIGGARQVVNLCSVDEYLGQGYYVSLLARARAQRAIPGIDTVTALARKNLYRYHLDELTSLVRDRVPQAEPGVKEIALEVFFGEAREEWARRMAARAYRLFPAPVLEIKLQRRKAGWAVEYIWPLSVSSISDDEIDRFRTTLADFCQSRRSVSVRRRRASFDLAILVDPAEKHPPSSEQTIRNFIRAADRQNLRAEVIGKKDIEKLTRFDALFIRSTTNIDNFTFTFARAAEAAGMPVIDDPDSILRCSNKVYLREAMARARIATPKSEMVTRANLKDVMKAVSYPAVLKIPDGSFSLGVFKADTPAELRERAETMLEKSAIVLAQEFLPTAFDWRIGVLDGKPLFACRYHMARGHWQVYNHAKKRGVNWGPSDTLPLEEAPPAIVKAALRASLQMGRSLYGVDLKEVDGKPYVIEVNDNPNIDAGTEDRIGGEAVYNAIMSLFRERILESKGLLPPGRRPPKPETAKARPDAGRALPLLIQELSSEPGR